jgi:hypothetical protein
MRKDSRSVTPAMVWQHVSDVEREQARRRRGLVSFWLLTLLGAGVGAAIGWTLGSVWLGLGLGALAGAVMGTAASVVIWVWPLLRAVWHWRLELAAVAVVISAASWIAHTAGSWWWSALLLGPAVPVAAVRPLRRRVVAFGWCQITRHRLRVCFAAFIRINNRVDPGLTPLILLIRATPAGERVWLWLRPGLDLAELEARSAKIAVACWASTVQVVASRRFAALVRLDITRRDPLTGLVTSPLVGGIPTQPLVPIEGDPSEGLGLDLLGVPETPEGAVRR